MAEHTFHLSVVAPERVVLETEARSVVLPAYDGQLGILAHRAPLLARLGAGRLTAETTKGEEVYFVTSTAAPIATGWSDQLPGGICNH